MPETTALSRYSQHYTAKKALFKLLGNAFRLYGPDGELRFYVKQKAFKLKEEIVVYADEGKTTPVLRIKARSMMDMRATYDVTDAASGETVGAMKRKGLKSIFRDEWSILDTDDDEIGIVQEDSGLMAIVRRYLIKILPQTYRVKIGGAEVGQIKQAFNPFLLSYSVDFSGDVEGALDPRLGVAAVVLLLAIEGRQSS